MTKTFVLRLDTGFVGATHEADVTFEFPDDATDKEIEEEVSEYAEEWAWERLDLSWEEKADDT